MAFVDLTAEQQGIVAEYTRQQRAGGYLATHQGGSSVHRHGGAGDSEHVPDGGAATVVCANGRNGEHTLGVNRGDNSVLCGPSN